MKKAISKIKLLEIMRIYYANDKNVDFTATTCDLTHETVTRYFRFLRQSYPLDYATLEENYTKELEENKKEIIEANVKYNKQKQKAMDNNRINQKTFREYARVENAVEEYAKSIEEVLKDHSDELKKQTIKHQTNKKKVNTGMIQLTDLHFNELVDLPNNKYDFKIASKRLKKYCDMAKKYFKANDIKKVVLCFTGDLLNSDRRLDELLNQAMNRAKASVLAVSLLKQFILDLNKDFNIDIFGVVGNEGRTKDEMTWSKNGLSDNYDYTILAHLRMMFDGCKGVNFKSIGEIETVIDIAGKHILLTHGLKFGKNADGDVVKAKTRFISKGIMLDYAIFGHIHSCTICDDYARSSSLVGSNAYNETALNVTSRASQNIFIVGSDITGIRCDLQDTEGYEGYNVINQLEASEQKSVEKAKGMGATVFKVVI